MYKFKPTAVSRNFLNGVWACVGAFLFVISLSSLADAASTMPSCASMGYKSTLSQCDGWTRLRCPWNSSAYFCGRSDSSNISGDAVDCNFKANKTNAQLCNDLGYKYTANECAGNSALACPFDNSKFYCKKNNCEADGYDDPACTSGQIELSNVPCPADANYRKISCQSCSGAGYTYSTEAECKKYCQTCQFNETCNKWGGSGTCPTTVTCAAGKVLHSNDKCYNTAQNFNTVKPVGVMISNSLAIDLEENTANQPLVSWSAGVNCHGTGASWPSGSYITKFQDIYFYGDAATDVVQAYNCTKNYCSHLSSYPGKWFLPSKNDLQYLRSNISSYISGMSSAGKSTSVTSINDSKISGIAIRGGISGPYGCACPRTDPDCTQSGVGGTKWNGGSISFGTYSGSGAASYRRCMRTVNQTGVSWNDTVCNSGGTTLYSSRCTNAVCMEDDLGSGSGSGTLAGGVGAGVVDKP